MDIVWDYKHPDKQLVRSLADALDASETFATLLVNRGIKTAEEAVSFITPRFENLKDPFLLKDMAKGVDRICAAIENDEKILIFGDFDADGVTATALLLDFLNYVEADVSWLIPHRIQEGYGFRKVHADRAADQDIDLIITVDCGAASHDAIRAAALEDIDVIVTDHHEFENTIPPAYAVINPKRADCTAGLDDLSGVGVVFHLVIALRKQLRDLAFWTDLKEPNLLYYCDLVALGTIGDMVPLSPENRILCMKGIDVIKTGRRTGLRTISDVSRIKYDRIDSDDLSFRLVPRINAAGRLSHARICVDLLTATEQAASEKRAVVLDSLNTKRQKIEQKIVRKVEEKIAENPDLLKKPGLVLWDRNWEPSVIGIAASKTAKKYAMPVILLSTAENPAVGSCRSVNQINIYAVIKNCSRLLEKFGGHAMAAGITVDKEQIETFAACVKDQLSSTCHASEFNKIVTIDGTLSFDDISFKLAKEIDRLRPFGTGNPEPLFASENISVVSSVIIGTKHRKMVLKHRFSETEKYIDAIQFNVDDTEGLPDFYERIVFRIRTDKFKKEAFQIILENI